VQNLKQQGRGNPSSSVLTSLPESPSFSHSSQNDTLKELSNETDNSTTSSLMPMTTDGSHRHNLDENEGSDLKSDSDLSDSDSLLLQTIPVAYKSRAAELLQLLKQNPDIVWDNDGKLIIENEIQLDGDFYKLYPQLFQPKHTHQNPTLQNLANFISTEGYGNYLHNFHTTGLILSKKRKLSENRNDVKKRLKLGNNWFYIGP
jgi:hypothetical protein